MLKEDLLRRQSDRAESVRNVAQARTTTALRVLHKDRRNVIFQFIRNSGLSDGLFIEANLHSVDLSNASMEFFNLSQAELTEANLSGANLRGAKLVQASLKEADLRGAILFGAQLIDADLSGADLRDAGMNKANLRGASLNSADLRETDLEGANLRETYLDGADLSGTYLIEAKQGGTKQEDTNLEGFSVIEMHIKRTIVNPERFQDAILSPDTTMPDGTKYDGRFDKKEQD